MWRLLWRWRLYRREHLNVPFALVWPICVYPEQYAVTRDAKTRVSGYALTALASATLLNLNGLKSSFTCTGVFLSTTFPKKGLGTGGEVEDCRESLRETGQLALQVTSTYALRFGLGR